MALQRTPNPPAISNRAAHARDRARRLKLEQERRERQRDQEARRAKQFEELKRGGN